MKLTRYPDRLDRIAAAYALGTLRGGARRRFEQMARDDVQVRAAALLWLGRWSAFAEIQAPVTPDAAVWIRIDNVLQAEKASTRPARMPDAVPEGAAAALVSRALVWWRRAALAGAVATVAALAFGLASLLALRAAPQIQYVAVLADGKAEASMLVTFDPVNNRLQLQRVGGFQEGANQSLQLWALPPQGAPRSLGVLGQGRLAQLTAQATEVQMVPALAISLEPRGGVASDTGPTGPVLFTGALIRRDS